MPPTEESLPQPLDLRIYLGMMLFRWQTIIVCLLYGLLGGVLFIQLTPKKYIARSRVSAYVDPTLMVPGYQSGLATARAHAELLRRGTARQEAAAKLAPKWGKILGDPAKLNLPLILKIGAGGRRYVEVSVRTENPKYGEAYLDEVLRAHSKNWLSVQTTSDSATERLLVGQLKNLEELIKAAEDDVTEYRRLHDIRRTELRGELEQGRIASLVSQRNALETQMWMLDVMFPQLKNESVVVLEGLQDFIESVGDVSLSDSGAPPREGGEAAGVTGAGGAEDRETITGVNVGMSQERYRLSELKQQERTMAQDLTAEHPRLQAVRVEIREIEDKMATQADLTLWGIRDSYRLLQLKHSAVEAAEYRWQAKDLIEMQKTSELKKLELTAGRLDAAYQSLFGRLQEKRLTQEINADRFSYTPPSASSKPVWPDAQKILLIALAIGLGSGLGCALIAQILDNKIQSIRDVEQTLGLPFLGGIPFWAHSGLERTIRPIVTEEHASGAVEAYRSLRTSVLAALAKENEKILLVTSADSREGKTLTTLNLAILIAQMKKKVLLVDMDLRRGRIHRSLGLEKEPGVSDVLREHLSLRDIIVKTRIDNLDLAPPGSSIEDAPELLQASGVDSLFLEVLEDYDYIIVDTSPVLRVTDSVIVAGQRYGVVMFVARVNHTPKPLLHYALAMLKEARIIGMVLNSIEMHKISSLYYTYQYPNYAYYSNAYSYGYNYAYYGDLADTEKRLRRHGSVLKEQFKSIAKWARDTFIPME